MVLHHQRGETQGQKGERNNNNNFVEFARATRKGLPIKSPDERNKITMFCCVGRGTGCRWAARYSSIKPTESIEKARGMHHSHGLCRLGRSARTGPQGAADVKKTAVPHADRIAHIRSVVKAFFIRGKFPVDNFRKVKQTEKPLLGKGFPGLHRVREGCEKKFSGQKVRGSTGLPFQEHGGEIGDFFIGQRAGMLFEQLFDNICKAGVPRGARKVLAGPGQAPHGGPDEAEFTCGHG